MLTLGAIAEIAGISFFSASTSFNVRVFTELVPIETPLDEELCDLTIKLFDPNLSICSSTSCLAPDPIEIIVITELTPIMIPSDVNTLLSMLDLRLF